MRKIETQVLAELRKVIRQQEKEINKLRDFIAQAIANGQSVLED